MVQDPRGVVKITEEEYKRALEIAKKMGLANSEVRVEEMGSCDRVSGSFWFLFWLFIIYESYRLGLEALYEPGPGFLFFWAGIVVAIMALIVVLKSSARSLRKR